jgi:hypothetical protein
MRHLFLSVSNTCAIERSFRFVFLSLSLFVCLSIFHFRPGLS